MLLFSIFSVSANAVKPTHVILAEKLVSFVQEKNIDHSLVIRVIENYIQRWWTNNSLIQALPIIKELYAWTSTMKSNVSYYTANQRMRKLASNQYTVAALSSSAEYQKIVEYFSDEWWYTYNISLDDAIINKVCSINISDQCAFFVQFPLTIVSTIAKDKCDWRYWVERSERYNDTWLCTNQGGEGITRSSMPDLIRWASIGHGRNGSHIYKTNSYYLFVVYQFWETDREWECWWSQWVGRDNQKVDIGWSPIPQWSYCYHRLEWTTDPDPIEYIIR